MQQFLNVIIAYPFESEKKAHKELEWKCRSLVIDLASERGIP